MNFILWIKRKWIGEWLKVPHRFMCYAFVSSAATYPPFSLILSIAASSSYHTKITSVMDCKSFHYDDKIYPTHMASC
jgi:hypothetical protein